MAAEPGRNPYVGPRAFEEADRQFFFGRTQETRQLAALIIAQRIVVFYAPSGAGKTSLIQAGLLPFLEGYRRIDVLPVGRVSGNLAPGSAAPVRNIYVYNTLVKVHGSSAPASLAQLSVADGLRSLLAGAGAARPRPHLLVVDQFEELFTTHPERFPERADFFAQLQQALAEFPQLSVLLAMREDFIAHLDFYAAQVPDRLRARFRIERLTPEFALEAIRAPAAHAGRPFAPGVAEGLVDDLRRVQMRQVETPLAATHLSGGELVTPAPESLPSQVLGNYVEPVHLQIICRQLWEKLPPDRTEILGEDVEQFGDVDEALTGFYETAVAAAVASGLIGERKLRSWIDGHLITPARTRGLVYRDEAAGNTDGLPNPVADILNNAYIIRAELRSGDTWYELAHDRLVEPILAANQAWQAAHPNPLAAPCQEWLASGRDATRLLRGRPLQDARRFATATPSDLSPDETAFLAASVSAVRARQRRWLLTAIAAVLVSIVVGGLITWQQLQRAETEAAQQKAVEELALRQRAEELASQMSAQAQYEAANAREQASLAEARALVASSQANLTIDPEQSILLAAQALALRPQESAEAAGALQQALRTSHIVRYLPTGSDGVQDVVYDPAGAWLATAGTAGVARIWDAVSGRKVLSFTEPTGPIWSLAVDPAGQTLATGAENGIVRLWNPSTGAEIRALAAPTTQAGEVRDVAFSADGTLLAAGYEDGSARVWDPSTGAILLTPPLRNAPVQGVAFSPDGLLLAMAGADGKVVVWDLGNDAPFQELTAHRGPVEAAAFSPDGRWLATAGRDGIAILWDAATWAPVYRFVNHTNWIGDVAFSPDSRRLATASYDHTAKVWNLDDGRELFTLAGPLDWLLGIAFSPDGRSLATVGAGGDTRIWDAALERDLEILDAHEADVRAVAYSPDGSRIATAGDDGQLKLWDGVTHTLIYSATHGASVRDVAFSLDGRYVATASDDRTAALWDAETGTLIRTFVGHEAPLTGVAFSPDGTRLASVGGEFRGLIWDVATGEIVHELTGFRLRLNKVAFSPDGRLVATAGGDGVVRLWDVETGQQVSELKGHRDQVYDVAFSPDGRQLASVSTDRTALLWDVASGQLLHTLEGHRERVVTVAFSPDGTQVATGSLDQTTRLWDAHSGALLRTLTGPRGWVWDVAFAPDGRRLASAGADKAVLFYDVNLTAEELRQLALQHVARPLSEEECQRYFSKPDCSASLMQSAAE